MENKTSNHIPIRELGRQGYKAGWVSPALGTKESFQTEQQLKAKTNEPDMNSDGSEWGKVQATGDNMCPKCRMTDNNRSTKWKNFKLTATTETAKGKGEGG